MSFRYLIAILFSISTLTASARAAGVDLRISAHSQGNLQLAVTNWGSIGSGSTIDPLTGDSIHNCVYPRGSSLRYLHSNLHIGAIVDGDTLVSNVWEMAPGAYPLGAFAVQTMNPARIQYSPKARSQLDLTCTYYDNSFNAFHMTGWDPRRHIPMDLAITQRSMAWGGASIDDFVMIEYSIANEGERHLSEIYVGLSSGARGSHRLVEESDGDNPVGRLPEYHFSGACPWTEELNLVYSMDNDGDPVDGRFTPMSPRAAVGIMLLSTSADSVRQNFNWWTGTNNLMESFGPRKRATLDDPFRPIGEFLGQPYKDVNMYYVMSHPEIDYDQLFTAAGNESDGWLPPPANAEYVANGPWGWFMLSFGPFELRPKRTISFTIAVVGGDNVHTDPYAYFDPLQPQDYYDQLDFSELATNARWAKWVYDNPGIDTDSDGYAGEFRICEGDTIWYKGDGVPDFRGNTPPPAPLARALTEHGRITVRWNGYFSETTKDRFSGLVDFEGYRVYSGLDTRRASLSLLTSYDRENFFRLKWNSLGDGHGKWLNDEPPYSLGELRTIHNDPNLDPHRFTRDRPLFEGDSVFQFQMVDGNQNSLTSHHGIRKAFPDAINPGTDSTLWTEDDVTHEHGRPLPKFYEYEYVIDGLLPTVPYFVSVTAFDFGYAGGRGNLPPDESNPLNNLIESYAQTSADSVETYQLDAYVYPNPYRADANYHGRGYENRTGRIIPNRARLLHFGNLPNVCKISIFSLDGDLIGTLDHNFPDGGPEAMHDWWNLVSRNGLAVESGMYYFVVESDTRTQIGKFVIIK